MVRQVNLYDAKTHLSQLVEDAANGEEIVIAKNGKPLAKLVEISPAQDSKTGKRVGGQWAKYLTPEELKYRRSPQFWRDWKAMDKEIERSFECLQDEPREYNSGWPDTSSTPTPSSTSKTTHARSGRKPAKSSKAAKMRSS